MRHRIGSIDGNDAQSQDGRSRLATSGMTYFPGPSTDSSSESFRGSKHAGLFAGTEEVIPVSQSIDSHSAFWPWPSVMAVGGVAEVVVVWVV